jgi:hypothetical protein
LGCSVRNSSCSAQCLIGGCMPCAGCLSPHCSSRRHSRLDVAPCIRSANRRGDHTQWSVLCVHCGLGHTKGGHLPQDVLIGLVLVPPTTDTFTHLRQARVDQPVVLSSGALRQQSYAKHVVGANESPSVITSSHQSNHCAFLCVVCWEM